MRITLINEMMIVNAFQISRVVLGSHQQNGSLLSPSLGLAGYQYRGR